ncbi:hypothetical protein BUY43_03330 [Staphylococcus devriesei]|uniref:Uncharacterized protein n=1 Tax=Staphylococcus devriesei TaxID=586733 RepID=A0A2K4DFJ3_9STAP|nr:hypothetical protein [Staphylococcus devriesei]MCE5090496.1 hypothetical protein [Staphylococcus devriesei]MCE5096622.1 hypothetical protein [Staphylococcus devriesei]PNZ85582.1 hypothetical protein CD147_11450 [Staphylococcus devriesei]PTE73161.1 hypothetical protein BUY44_07085 [Staphylococcus devriesei]PTF02179.1 hypothetical protein BUY45_10515 [Staphylococcus devriesei]
MAHEDNKDVEVIDPSDQRYKDDRYFNHPEDSRNRNYSMRYQYGCGCPFGCFSSIFISILLSIILTFLLNWLF